jgi:hypothetical protein
LVRNPTTTFRFDQPFVEFLDRMAKSHGLSKTDVVRQSTLIVGALFAEAQRNALADLAALRERHGDAAELTCLVDIASDGNPVGMVLVSGEPADDVRVRPYVDQQGGVVHLYLEVDRERAEGPNHVPFAGEWLLVPEPRMPLGALPWPLDKGLAIRITLGDLAEVLPEPVKAVALA